MYVRDNFHKILTSAYKILTYGTYQASSYLSVMSRSPLRAMKVSRPQHLMNPVEKWGSPAANEAVGSSSGVDGGSWAELLTPQSWIEPRARLWMKDEPFWTNLFERRQAFMNDTAPANLYNINEF